MKVIGRKTIGDELEQLAGFAMRATEGTPADAIGLLLTAAISLAIVADDAGIFPDVEGGAERMARDVISKGFASPEIAEQARRLFSMVRLEDGAPGPAVRDMPRGPRRVQ